MKKGFTLLEIIVVLIILGIIATLGFLQYTRVIEKGRTSEAKTNLGTIRTMAMAYYEENGSYPDDTYINGVLGLPTTNACDARYFYFYSINGGAGGTGQATATRCGTGAGKPPGCAAPACPANYTLTLDQQGNPGSNSGMW